MIKYFYKNLKIVKYVVFITLRSLVTSCNHKSPPLRFYVQVSYKLHLLFVINYETVTKLMSVAKKQITWDIYWEINLAKR
jgi:hypothetical protein